MNKYNRIKDLRRDKDWTQEETAKKMYMHRTQYRRYENGESELPLNIAIMMSELYDVSIDYIAGLTNDKGGKHYKYKNEEEKEIVELWKQLNEEEKAEIKNSIEYKLKIKKQKEEKRSVV
ncbi:MAG: helix-turn-helix transcriptional regulator [Oscillospiraceae bacterium]|nr:helix-turn-helix transcriptional regulator [Oscillospiraceae bacterium]